MKSLIFISLVLATLVSCGRPTTQPLTAAQDNFISNLKSEFPGEDVRLLKITKINGVVWLVINAPDEYPDNDINFDQRINLENYDPNTSARDFLEANRIYSAWVSGNTYEDFSGGCCFYEATGSASKDLEKIGSAEESVEVAKMENTLIDYGFSADRAEKLGKLMVSYNKIKSTRSLNNREKDFFTKELTGMTFKKASEALVNHGYDSLVDKASEVNGADPEAIKELLNEIM